jgi:hypothetical protein
VNKTPLSAETNREIGGRAPSAYLARLQRRYALDESALDERLRSHVIDPRLLRADDFDGFFRARARRLLDLIEDSTGKEV